MQGFVVGNGGFCGGESGVFEVGLFRFRLKKKGGTSHDVPMLKKILVDFRLDLPFLYFVFWCFCGAKIVFFLFIRVFSWRKSGVFFVHCGECGVGNGGFFRFKCGVCGI